MVSFVVGEWYAREAKVPEGKEKGCVLEVLREVAQVHILARLEQSTGCIGIFDHRKFSI